MKKLPSKNVEKILKQSEHLQEEKKYKPGQVLIKDTQFCRARIVNFFGDVHTEVFTVQASPNDQFVAAGCSNGDIKVYNIFEGKIISLLNTSRKGGYPNTSARWKTNSNSEYVGCNCDGTIKWYKSEQVVGYYESDIGYLCCDYERNNGEWVVFGKENYQIQIFDHEKKKIKQKYSGGDESHLHPNHTNRVFSLRTIKQQPNLFFSGGWDSTIKIWDIRVPTDSIRSFAGPTITADSLDYRKGQLLVGNYQNHDIVQLWDFKHGKLIETLDIKESPKGNSYCFSASYAKKSQFDVIGVALSGCNKVKILKDKKLVNELQFQAAPLSIQFYRFNDKDYLLVGGIEGTVYAIKLKWLK